MKLNKVFAICKSSKQVYIFNDLETGAQWLSDGIGIYLLEGIPRLTSTDECLRLFDIPESKWYSYLCKYRNLPEGVDFTNEIGTGCYVEEMTTTIGLQEKTYRLFKDGEELYAVNQAYLAPFTGDDEYIRYHRRETKCGGFLLGVNVGLGLKAIIYPYYLHRKEEFVCEMNEISHTLLFMQQNFPAPSITSTTQE